MGIINEITENVYMYYGDAVFLIAAIMSYVYLLVKSEDLRGKLLYPIGLIMFCVVNPVLYKLVFSEIIYWRLFWMFPDAIIIAAASTKLLKNLVKKWQKILLFAALMLMILLTGKNAFLNADYVIAENWHKIPNEIKEVCDIILEIDDEPSCIMPEALYSDVRQYSGDIEMLYGRNAIDRFIIKSNVASKRIYLELNKEDTDYDYVFAMSSTQNCNFVVLEEAVDDEIAAGYGYELIEDTDKYYIYYNGLIDRDSSTGWLVSQYGKEDSYKRTYITLEDGNGGLIIIDGGTKHNAYNIRQLIKAYGDHVTAWIITNPDRVYSEAFHKIIEEQEDIVIDAIYTLPSDYYDYQQAGRDVNYVGQGDGFEAGDLYFEVFYLYSNEKQNYSSICLSVTGENDSLLLCTSANQKTKKYIEEEFGLMIPEYSTRLKRGVFR